MFFNKKAESSALLELEYLKGDVERLLTLLKSTQEVLFIITYFSKNFAKSLKNLHSIKKEMKSVT